MTITKERLIELVRQVGGAMEPGLAPVFNTHAEVHKLARLVREQQKAELLEGVGEPHRMLGNDIYGVEYPVYTADQVAAAVLRSRNQILDVIYSYAYHLSYDDDFQDAIRQGDRT